MASIKDMAATSALNEEDYINELYDVNLGKQNQLLKDNLDTGNAVLDNAQQLTQDKTDSYVTRTETEAQKAKGLYGNGGVSTGAQAQVQLSQENARRKNVTALRDAQSNADAEFQRQRQLLASQYEADIRKAQADNDMEKAQALYEAAKAEEAQLRELQMQGAALLQSKGDSSGYDAIAAGQRLPQNPGTESWEGVFRNEDALNAIFDAQLEGQQVQLGAEYEKALSDLEAQRLAKERQTDALLTEAYVNSLRDQKSAAEYGTAHGRASGTAAQGMLAEDIALQNTLTQLRKNQLEADTNAGVQGFQLELERGQGLDQAQREIEAARIQALLEAAENEEQIFLEDQALIGKQAAANGDYRILGLLYGLTPEQIAALTPKPAEVPGGWMSEYNTGLTREQIEEAQERDRIMAVENALKEAIVAGNKAAAFDRFKNK